MSRVREGAGTRSNRARVSSSARRRPRLRSVLLALGLVLPVCAAAQVPSGASGWSGTLGIGPVAFPRYIGGKELQVLPLPIAYVNYNDWFYVDLYRTGVYVWGSEDKKKGISFSVEPRLGFHSSDGARLEGMATRRGSVSGGPTFDWQSGANAFSLGYFTDLSHASGGGYADVLMNHTFAHDDRWDASWTIEITRLDSKIVGYYFGVPASEATPTRPQYEPSASTNVTLWLTGQYNLTKREALMFGTNLMRLGRAAADSPIVEQKLAPLFYVGIGLNL
jgi:MipA family protein